MWLVYCYCRTTCHLGALCTPARPRHASPWCAVLFPATGYGGGFTQAPLQALSTLSRLTKLEVRRAVRLSVCGCCWGGGHICFVRETC